MALSETDFLHGEADYQEKVHRQVHRDIATEVNDLISNPPDPALQVLKAKGLSTSSIANTTADITWDADITATDFAIDGTNAYQVNISADGVYLFDVTARSDSANRTEMFIRTYIDVGSGFVEDTDEIVSDYTARDVDQNTGAVSLHTALDLNDGDKVKFVAEGDCDGTCVLMTAGTILRVIKAS